MREVCGMTALAAAITMHSLGIDAAQAQARAGNYPNKALRLIVPFAPGGGTDIMSRVLAQQLSDGLGQTVIVDNRAGGGGTIGTETLVRATPDGYTLILMSGSYATNAALFKLPYDPVHDITPIAVVGESCYMIALNPAVPARTVKELIALAKAKPGSLNFASTGTGGLTHLSYELFNMMAGTRMTHVPYKGTGGLLTDLLSGQVHLTFGGMLGMMPQVKPGRLRGIAVTTIRRNAAVPDIPTVAETVPGYEVAIWYGVWGPKNLPRDVAALLNKEVNRAVHSPAMKERMASEGVDAVGGAPAQLFDLIQRDIPKWTKVVKEAGVNAIQ